MEFWTPQEMDANDTDIIRVKAINVFQIPILVCTTKAQIWGIITILKKKTKKSLKELRTEKYNACVAYKTEDSKHFQDFRSNVLVYFCACFELDGTKIPLEEKVFLNK